jgi:hypothetical protein
MKKTTGMKKDTDNEERAKKPLGLHCPWHPCNQTVVLPDSGFSTSPYCVGAHGVHPARLKGCAGGWPARKHGNATKREGHHR